MTKREELEANIRKSLAKAGLSPDAATVRLQEDPYGGWRIAVITAEFQDLAPGRRRAAIQAGLGDERVAWLDALAPEEVEWAGPLPGEIEPEDLPLWPESLARTKTPTTLLASDLDEDLPAPIVVTFYSLRGGVGRSTALAHTARLLASASKRVICVDMDLEAPALPVLLDCEDSLTESMGVVSLLSTLDQGGTPDFSAHLLEVPGSDSLFVLPAGKVGPEYARRLQEIDPRSWYQENRNPLRSLLDGLREGLPFAPDVILLDARTGITDLSGPLLFDLADIAVVLFFPHPQAVSGTRLLTESVLRTTTRRSVSDQRRVVPELRFIVSPTPSSSDPHVRRRYEQRPLSWISDWLIGFNSLRKDNDQVPIDPSDITHFVNYREEIATSDSVHADSKASSAFVTVADWINRFLETSNEAQAQASVAPSKAGILRELSFSAGTAEEQEDVRGDFVQTERMHSALSEDIAVVLGRKGTGKTAVFRFLLEKDATSALVVHAPAALRENRVWMLGPDALQHAEEQMEKSGLRWRNFWVLYIAVAVVSQAEWARSTIPEYLGGISFQSQRWVLDALQQTGSQTGGAILLQEWLQALDKAAPGTLLLLFDGLDTGFGSAEVERTRRRESIEGLFEAWMELGQQLRSVKFKIMLREDIWRELNFANRSHLFGKTANLKWSDQTSFLKVVLKQAMKSSGFEGLAKSVGIEHTDVDSWQDGTVRTAWSLLIGERMKGGQTAYTRNWVWNRLADANTDHSPRYLLQLFREATTWEMAEDERASYERSLIRPRALQSCLEQVSREAVGALREEFQELEPMLQILEQAGRTPVDASILDSDQSLVQLAKEVGLLGVYEESGDEVTRFKVPDLYRLGLGMTRKGQA